MTTARTTTPILQASMYIYRAFGTSRQSKYVIARDIIKAYAQGAHVANEDMSILKECVGLVLGQGILDEYEHATTLFEWELVRMICSYVP